MYQIDTGSMNKDDILNNVDRKVLDSLSFGIELTMTNLMIKTGHRNRNTVIESVNKLESMGLVSSRRVGRERLVLKTSLEKATKRFVDNYDITLKNYSKIINENLKLLEKNMPLVPNTSNTMKKIKIREPVLELDKEKNRWTDQGKTREGHAFTWKTREKPLEHFNIILTALNGLYQESSAISFSEFIGDESRNKDYQKDSKKLIKDTLSELERIFDKDFKSKHYGNFVIGNTLSGLIHQIMLDDKRKPKH